jgi:hypothetical protein
MHAGTPPPTVVYVPAPPADLTGPAGGASPPPSGGGSAPNVAGPAGPPPATQCLPASTVNNLIYYW